MIRVLGQVIRSPRAISTSQRFEGSSSKQPWPNFINNSNVYIFGLWTCANKSGIKISNLFLDVCQHKLRRRNRLIIRQRTFQIPKTTTRLFTIFLKVKLSILKFFLSQLRWTKKGLNMSELSWIPSQNFSQMSTTPRGTTPIL